MPKTLGDILRQRTKEREQNALRALENALEMVKEHLRKEIRDDDLSLQDSFYITSYQVPNLCIPSEYADRNGGYISTLSPKLKELYLWFNDEGLEFATDKAGVKVWAWAE